MAEKCSASKLIHECSKTKIQILCDEIKGLEKCLKVVTEEHRIAIEENKKLKLQNDELVKQF